MLYFVFVVVFLGFWLKILQIQHDSFRNFLLHKKQMEEKSAHRFFTLSLFPAAQNLFCLPNPLRFRWSDSFQGIFYAHIFPFKNPQGMIGQNLYSFHVRKRFSKSSERLQILDKIAPLRHRPGTSTCRIQTGFPISER